MTTAVAWALAWHRQAMGGTASVEPLARGVQSDVFLLRGAAEAETFVLKQFNRAYGFNSAAAVRLEVDTLQKLAAALSGRDDLGCPRVVAEAPDSWAYLMTYCDGQPLVDERPDAETTAARLLTVLESCYEAVSAPYCDFQPGNVLVAGDRLYVLDPTLPNPLFDEVIASGDPARWARTDVGFWIHAVAASTVRAPHRLDAQRWLFGTTSRLLALAAARFEPDDTGGFVRDAFSVARFHAKRFATLSRGSRVAHPAKALVLRALESRVVHRS